MSSPPQNKLLTATGAKPTPSAVTVNIADQTPLPYSNLSANSAKLIFPFRAYRERGARLIFTIGISLYVCLTRRNMFGSGWTCPAWCPGGRRPLFAGCSSLQRLGVDFPITPQSGIRTQDRRERFCEFRCLRPRFQRKEMTA